MATETKKTEAAAAAAPPIEARCLTLRQKLVEMRKACPEIVKKKHSEGVKYKYAKIYDVWEKITPIMNELGVDFEVIGEKATRYAENGDPVYWITMQTKTYNGDKLMFLYEADLTIRWINLDNDDETLEAVVHALGWNDDPAKAKGAAHTYALKYYLFEKFSIDQGEDDPDNSDFGAQSKGSGGGSGGSRQGQQRQDGNHPVDQRRIEILHGHRRQVRQQHGQHQLDGLQLADLALSRQTQAHDQQQIQNDGAEKSSGHRHSPFYRQYARGRENYTASSGLEAV